MAFASTGLRVDDGGCLSCGSCCGLVTGGPDAERSEVVVDSRGAAQCIAVIMIVVGV